MISTLRKTAAFVVIGHFFIVLIHGIAHFQLEIFSSLWATVFIFAVIWIAPILSLILLYKGQANSGALLLFASMAGAFIFGGYNHFIAVSSDHIAHAPQGIWLVPFQITAILLALAEIAGSAIGLWLYLNRGKIGA